MQPGPLPGLAGWLLQSGFATLEDWRSHKRRAELEAALTKAVSAGRIGAMLMLVDDQAAKDADEAGAEAAIVRVRELEAQLKAIRTGAPERIMAAHQLGYEVATAAGLLATLGRGDRVGVALMAESSAKLGGKGSGAVASGPGLWRAAGVRRADPVDDDCFWGARPRLLRGGYGAGARHDTGRRGIVRRAGALSPLWHLWMAHDRMEVALASVGDLWSLTLAWGGGACAWALCQILPAMLQSFWNLRESLRARAIEEELKQLRDEWPCRVGCRSVREGGLPKRATHPSVGVRRLGPC